jgi:hypothetical protein
MHKFTYPTGQVTITTTREGGVGATNRRNSYRKPLVLYLAECLGFPVIPEVLSSSIMNCIMLIRLIILTDKIMDNGLWRVTLQHHKCLYRLWSRNPVGIQVPRTPCLCLGATKSGDPSNEAAKVAHDRDLYLLKNFPGYGDSSIWARYSQQNKNWRI